MILLDAIYINDGGGKILLDIIIKDFISRRIPIFFLLDKRLEFHYSEIEPDRRLFLKPSLLKRHQFYFKNRNRFSVVLSFSNLPPTIRLNCKVFTYFHNVLFLDKQSVNKTKNPIINFIKSLIIRINQRNTDYWVVQSNVVKELLIFNWKINSNKITIFPIFENIKISNKIKSTNVLESTKRLNFLYVSDGHLHKNHLKLIEAFGKHSQSFPMDTLTLTVNFNFTFVCSVINEYKNKGVKIINKGFLSREQLLSEYDAADIFLYPSLKESFGLGLIEASQYGLPIISANLPYVMEVIVPSAVFDPNSIEDMVQKIHNSRFFIDKPAKLVTKNKLNDLINLLVSTSNSLN